jgi:ergothioneine biosynthesis protein EgtB
METLQEQKTGTDRFLRVRKQTEKICMPLLAEDFSAQPVPFVSPPKWHLAHTSWFFETFILSVYSQNYKVFNPAYNYLFNSYYESVGERLPRSDRGNITRPDFQEILQYRAYINNHMKLLLEKTDNPKVLKLTELGIQHEQQHQELLVTDIKYILGHNPLYPQYTENSSFISSDSAPAKYLEVEEGVYQIGHQGKDFSFDNESSRHRVFLETFQVMNRLVTNQEYLEFIHDGGYEDFHLWHSEGWETIKNNKWKAPLYWVKQDDQWYEYTLNGLEKIKPGLPVTHVSFYEAAAFAEWKGERLLTEAEWEIAATKIPGGKITGNFLESGIFHPAVASRSSTQFFGDCWEWTNSAYLPYPGYKREKGAIGEYNSKFMINQMVLRGGSCATPKNHIRISYRNFFHADTRWQFSGIRLAKTL